MGQSGRPWLAMIPGRQRYFVEKLCGRPPPPSPLSLGVAGGHHGRIHEPLGGLSVPPSFRRLAFLLFVSCAHVRACARRGTVESCDVGGPPLLPVARTLWQSCALKLEKLENLGARFAC